MGEAIDRRRRRFCGTAALTIAAAGLTIMDAAQAQQAGNSTLPAVKPGTHTSFGPLKQINAGLLNVGYAEAGPADSPTVILVHGWPYDLHSFVDVRPVLAAAGCCVIIPYLRGYGSTRWLESGTLRNGQQSLVAVDLTAGGSGSRRAKPNMTLWKNSAYAKKFTGKYEHLTIRGSIGHNMPPEAPHAFADHERAQS